MSSSHRHGKTGHVDPAGTIDADLAAAIAAHEAKYHATPATPPVVVPPVDPPPVVVPPVIVPAPRVITVGPGKAGYTPKAGETLDGWEIIGPGAGKVDLGSDGVLVKVPNVTIRNCHIHGFGGSGIRGDGASNLTIVDSIVEDACYAGIITTGVAVGTISRCVISRVGIQANNGNAYGIALSMWSGGKRTTDCLVSGNIVEDVPLWHGMDTHGGQRIIFRGNNVARCARAIFITDNQTGENPSDITITGNLLVEPKTAGGTDANSAIFLNQMKTGTNVVSGNIIDPKYPTMIDNYGKSSVYTESGNVRGTSR